MTSAPQQKRDSLGRAPPAGYGAGDGSVWVRRGRVGDAGRTIIDVFPSDGRLTAVAILPRAIAIEPHPSPGLDRVVAIGIDPETGANLVFSYSVSVRRGDLK